MHVVSRKAALAMTALLSLGLSCISAGEFPCSQDAECGAGRCENEGYCSILDDGCDSGRRFSKYVPDSLAGRCVDPEAGGSSSDDSTGGSTSIATGLLSSATDAAGTGTGTTTTTSEVGSSDGGSSGTGIDSACVPAGRDPAAPALLYDFCEGAGTTVRSIFGEPFPLVFENGSPGDGFEWVADGLSVELETYATTAMRSSNVIADRLEACTERNEVTVEVWVTPHSYEQGGPTVLAALGTRTPSQSGTDFSLKMHPGPDWTLKSAGYMGSIHTDQSGAEGLATIWLGIPLLQTTHLAIVHEAGGDDLLYMDGELLESQPHPGTFATWNPNFDLVLANKPNNENRNWGGVYHLVAIYCEALSAERIATNFDAGHRP